MEVVAEAVLSVSLELLFEKLSSSDDLKFARQEHIQKQLKIWETKLLEISEVLNDAEEKQIAKESVKAWLRDLRDLAYDMEDVLDEFSYKALRRRLETESSTGSKVRKFIPICCGPVQAIRNVKTGSKIKDLNRRLDDIYSRKAGLGLDKVAVIANCTWERPLVTSSLVPEPLVFGRDADKQNIMDMLLKADDPNQTDSFSVVSIVAMGGTGKTTLARLVYDDDKITSYFNLKAWACVSDPFNAMRVTKTILNEFTSGSSNDSLEFNQIQNKLREELKGKKFLLVLDDIWTDNYDDWRSLQPPFFSGAPGSKIIITTRNKNVATKIMGGDKNLYELRHLSDDGCWSVFLKHAFGNDSINEYPELEQIGRGIASKCGGLPLAACALGGLLRNERRVGKWDIILNSPILDLPGNHNSNILPALKLSYNVLPPPLKRCFGYCAIFPKDYDFDKKELIRLWMAEDFIQQSDGQKIEMEDLGDDFFRELLSRSFFQPSSSKESFFVMHDLVNDLAKLVATEICFSLEENSKRNQNGIMPRHSSFTRGEGGDVFKKFEVFHKMKEHLRTFVALPIGAPLGSCWLSNKVLESLIPKFKCLRVLSLSGYMINEIPDSIGDLKHLRYLNLSKTQVTQVPESIGKLYMLQTLILLWCRNLTRLPLSTWNLNSLRYLDVTDTPLEEMPSQMSKLKSLQMLSTFIVGKDNASNIKELMSMSHLSGRLHISKLENVIDVPDARAASVFRKQKLENLRMSWSDSANDGNQLAILDSLQPHLGLNELGIEGYGGPKFPPWLEDFGFSKMVVIKLVNCKNCKFLPRLGQLPMLKYLAIQGMDEVNIVGKEFHGGYVSFPMLESLTFSNMPQWEDWESPSSLSYPRLLLLTIRDCPKLIKELPTHLPSIVHLDIRRCPRLESLLARFPSLSQLHISHCNESVVRGGVDYHSLKKLELCKIIGLTELQEGFVQLLSGLQYLVINSCDELRGLWAEENGFDGIQKLKTSNCPKEQHSLLSKLQSLNIEDCLNLEKLPNGLHSLSCLQELTITKCPKLSSFPESGFPPMLTKLAIEICVGLTCLPDWIMVARDGSDSHVCILEDLTIFNCPSLICFPGGQLLPTLQTLIIRGCEKLESLPEGMMMQPPHDSGSSSSCDGGLHLLEIGTCSSLKFFPTGKFPSTLKQLFIKGNNQLESISEKMFHSDNNNSLEVLRIGGYPSLKTIPDCFYNLRSLNIWKCQNLEGLPHQMQNLRELTIRDCENLEGLPHQMQNLRELTILDCENLEGLPHQMQNLRELTIRNCENLEGLPHQMQNLRELRIYDCKIVELELQGLTALTSLDIENCGSIRTPLSRWGLAMLPSLKYLSIGGIFPEITSFSDGSSLLPTSLTYLCIRDFRNLKSLASLSLQTLTSLQVLRIWDCPKLESFCPKEGLPDTLSHLYISRCPLLKERCSKQKGQDWAHIFHIPRVTID